MTPQGQEINWLLVLIIPGALLAVQLIVGGLSVWMIAIYKSSREEARDQRKGQDAKIEGVKDDLSAVVAALPKDYVLRSDFIPILSSFNAKTEAIKDEVSAFKAALPQQYVLRDDFIRVITGFDAKLDRLVELFGLHRRDTHEPPG